MVATLTGGLPRPSVKTVISGTGTSSVYFQLFSNILARIGETITFHVGIKNPHLLCIPDYGKSYALATGGFVYLSFPFVFVLVSFGF